MERNMLIREISNLIMNHELPFEKVYPQSKSGEFEIPQKKQKPQTTHKLNKEEVLQIQKILKIDFGIDEVHRTGQLDSKTVNYLDIYLPNGLWRKFNYGEIKKKLLDEKKAIIRVSGKVSDLDTSQSPTSIDQIMQKKYNFQLKDFQLLVTDIVDTQILILETWMYAIDRMKDILSVKPKEKAPNFLKILGGKVFDSFLKKGLDILLKRVPLGAELYNSFLEYKEQYDKMLSNNDMFEAYTFIFNFKDDLFAKMKLYKENKNTYIAQMNTYFDSLRSDVQKQKDFFGELFNFRQSLENPDFDRYFVFIVEMWINNSRNTEDYARYNDYKNGIVSISISHDWQKISATINAPLGTQIGLALTKFGTKPFSIDKLKVHRRFTLSSPNGWVKSQVYINKNNVPQYINSKLAGNDTGLVKDIQSRGVPPTLKIS